MKHFIKDNKLLVLILSGYISLTLFSTLIGWNILTSTLLLFSCIFILILVWFIVGK